MVDIVQHEGRCLGRGRETPWRQGSIVLYKRRIGENSPAMLPAAHLEANSAAAVLDSGTQALWRQGCPVCPVTPRPERPVERRRHGRLDQILIRPGKPADAKAPETALGRKPSPSGRVPGGCRPRRPAAPVARRGRTRSANAFTSHIGENPGREGLLIRRAALSRPLMNSTRATISARPRCSTVPWRDRWL